MKNRTFVSAKGSACGGGNCTCPAAVGRLDERCSSPRRARPQDRRRRP